MIEVKQKIRLNKKKIRLNQETNQKKTSQKNVRLNRTKFPSEENKKN